MRQATGLRSLANVSQPMRSASRGIEPPPANGSTTSGGSPPYTTAIIALTVSRNTSSVEKCHEAHVATNCSSAIRKSFAVHDSVASIRRQAVSRRCNSCSAWRFLDKLPVLRSVLRSATSRSVPCLLRSTCFANFLTATPASHRNSGGQSGSHGSGNNNVNKMAREEASGRRAHHKCNVEG